MRQTGLLVLTECSTWARRRREARLQTCRECASGALLRHLLASEGWTTTVTNIQQNLMARKCQEDVLKEMAWGPCSRPRQSTRLASQGTERSVQQADTRLKNPKSKHAHRNPRQRQTPSWHQRGLRLTTDRSKAKKQGVSRTRRTTETTQKQCCVRRAETFTAVGSSLAQYKTNSPSTLRSFFSFFSWA